MFGISDEEETQKVCEKYPILEEVMGRMHGSGINSDWYALDKGKYVILYNAYESMNDAGMYDYNSSFSITIDKTDIQNVTVRCHESNRYYWNKYCLKEYLEDTYSGVLLSCIEDMSGIFPIKSGFREVKKYELVRAQQRSE